MLRQFTWKFQTHFDHLSEEQLSGSGYLEHITAILDILAGERSSSEKRRTIRAALYEGSRRSDEGLAQYGLRREAQFANADPFMIPDELKAFLLEEQANLNKQNLQNLRTITAGSQDYSSVKKALQILDTQEEPLSKKNSSQFLELYHRTTISLRMKTGTTPWRKSFSPSRSRTWMKMKLFPSSLVGTRRRRREHGLKTRL